MILDPGTILLLAATALAAGFVDAVAGGGGLLTVPALLSAGLPPVAALATNKVQSACGTASAAAHFIRSGYVDLRLIAGPVLAALAGSGLGALAVQRMSPRGLAALMPLLLVAIACYFLLSPRAGEAEAHRRLTVQGYAAVAALVGFYDGFFGPGAGSFYALSLVALLGMGLTRATAHTKLLNLGSNLVAVLVFAAGGQVVWTAALAMAAGQVVGGRLGSHAAMRWGAGFIRPLLVLVSLAMTARLLADPANPLRRALGY